MSRHTNNGKCDKCAEIFNKYPGFYFPLRIWFESLQAENPEAHISEAGRGRDKQELYKQRGASKASFGKSAHNWNAAIDIFELRNGKAVWDKAWFNKVVAPRIDSSLTWYGAPGSKFWELPHVQVKAWRELAKEGHINLVEEPLADQPEINANPKKLLEEKPVTVLDTIISILNMFGKKA